MGDRPCHSMLCREPRYPTAFQLAPRYSRSQVRSFALSTAFGQCWSMRALFLSCWFLFPAQFGFLVCGLGLAEGTVSGAMTFKKSDSDTSVVVSFHKSPVELTFVRSSRPDGSQAVLLAPLEREIFLKIKIKNCK